MASRRSSRDSCAVGGGGTKLMGVSWGCGWLRGRERERSGGRGRGTVGKGGRWRVGGISGWVLGGGVLKDEGGEGGGTSSGGW